MDRNMMLTPDEYMAIMRLISSEKESEGATLAQSDDNASRPKKRRKSAYQRRYAQNFEKIAPNYKLRSGRWKKNGFKQAVRQAHKMSKK